MKAIATKMSQVGKAVGFGIPKDGRNQAQGYDYTSAANVRMTVGPEMAARKIAVASEATLLHREAFNNARGNRQHHVLISVTLTFVDGDTGETMTAAGLGEGVDSGDKASAKAMTMATKYALVNAFTLAMGEDPERDEQTDQSAGRVGEKLSTPGYAFGDEEAARAARQADEKSLAKAEADGLINSFTSLISGDEASAWIRENAAVWDAIDKTQRVRVYRACLTHVKKGLVDGMTEAGFVEELEYEVKKQRKQEVV
jgi:hypothetical protein